MPNLTGSLSTFPQANVETKRRADALVCGDAMEATIPKQLITHALLLVNCKSYILSPWLLISCLNNNPYR